MGRILRQLSTTFCSALIMIHGYQAIAMSATLVVPNKSVTDNEISYFYQGDQISAIDSDQQARSFLLANHDRIMKLDLSVGASDVAEGSYLGDGKNQDIRIDQATSGMATLTAGHTQLLSDYQGYGQKHQRNEKIEFGYDGEYHDQVTDLSYLRARDYQPATQRFITMDSYPLFNRYHFTNQDPINNVDPSGHIDQKNQDILVAGGLLLMGLALTWAGYKYTSMTRNIEVEAEAGQEIDNATRIKVAAFAVGSSPAMIATYIQKRHAHATALNTFLSVALPTVAAGFGTFGIITNSYWAQAVDNMLEGISFPIINSDGRSKINPWDMVFGAVSGYAAGYVGGYFTEMGLRPGGGYANAAAAFFARGMQMEMVRSAVYNLGELLTNNESSFNIAQNIVDVAASGVPLALEGLVLYPGVAGMSAATTGKQLFGYATLFNAGGSIMQVGWPYADTAVQSLFH